MAASSKARVVHGDDLLYRFFKGLFDEDESLAEHLPLRMVAEMAIWLPEDIYFNWPVLLPWVVRDGTCRGSPRRGIPDQWGSPDERGFLRDDNSLIKGLPRSLEIFAPTAGPLHGARLGTEFVASHVWRVVLDDSLASRHPLLNSFVPNLVWLPLQVSKLSDREGGPLQRAVQAMAWSVYRHAPVAPHLKDVVEEAWSLIPEPNVLVEPAQLHRFVSTQRFFTTRRARLQAVVEALERLSEGLSLEKKVVTTRYTEGLPSVDAEARDLLLNYLAQFLSPS